MSTQKLDDAAKQIITDLYAATGKTVDDLPYTAEFDNMFDQFCSITGRDIGRHDFWKALANLRKASRLVRKIR